MWDGLLYKSKSTLLIQNLKIIAKNSNFAKLSDFGAPWHHNHNRQCKFSKANYFFSPLATILVLVTLLSNQPLVHKGGRPRGRQSGRKCGDVDDYLSDHGTWLKLSCSGWRRFSSFDLWPENTYQGMFSCEAHLKKLNSISF